MIPKFIFALLINNHVLVTDHEYLIINVYYYNIFSLPWLSRCLPTKEIRINHPLLAQINIANAYWWDKNDTLLITAVALGQDEYNEYVRDVSF
jgi:hypothetical protein